MEYLSVRRDAAEVFLPVIPVDKYAAGKIRLARDGKKLILPKEKDS